MKKQMRLSTQAQQFAEVLTSSKNPPFKTKKEVAQLGFAIAFSESDHRDFKMGESENFAHFASIDENKILSTIYREIYNDAEDDVLNNIEKACSYGILKLKDSFFDEGKKMLDWTKLNKHFS